MAKYEAVWHERLKLYKEFKEVYGREPKAKDIYKETKIGVWCIEQRKYFNNNKLSDEKVKLLETVEFNFTNRKEKDTKIWNRKYELYKEFKNLYNHEPSQSTMFKGVKLGSWYNAQKQNYYLGKLSKKRMHLLEEANFISENLYDKQWDDNFELYKEFKDEHGREPKGNEIYKNVRIGNWCSNQRVFYKKEKLQQNRFELLQEKGFIFSSRNEQFENRWNYKFQLYKEFKELYGREPKNTEIYKNEFLGKWCVRQKENNDNGKLSEEKYKLLSSVNFNFDSSSNYQWNKKYELYKEFKQQYAREPMYSEEYKNINLDDWCRYQRKLNKENKLNEEYKRLLKEACFDFQMKSVNSKLKWDDKYNIYKEYKQLYGHEPNHDEVYKGINLDDWCVNQRNANNQGKLSKERFELLKKAGFIFENLHDKNWNQNLTLYKQFKVEYNREPQKTEKYKEINLADWCSNQKSMYNQCKLSKERFKLLNEVGFDFENKYEKQWNYKYEIYKEFKEAHEREPEKNEIYKNTNLGAWCATQKTRYKKGKLSIQRTKLLNEAGFIFSKKNAIIPQNNLHDKKWIKKYELYKEFKELYGREPKREEIYKETFIERWCRTQRNNFHNYQLSKDKIKLLEEVGFSFDKLLDEKWIKNFELYKEFKIIHSREPYLKEKYKDNNIGRWVAYQRRLLKRGELEEYKVVLLQNENFIF